MCLDLMHQVDLLMTKLLMLYLILLLLQLLNHLLHLQLLQDLLKLFLYRLHHRQYLLNLL